MNSDLEAAKEAWAQAMARHFESSRIEPEVIIEACRWAGRWVDDYKCLVEQSVSTSRSDLVQVIKQTFATSLERSPAVRRYHTGAPVLRATMIAEQTFCAAFGDEADLVLELIGLEFSAEHL